MRRGGGQTEDSVLKLRLPPPLSPRLGETLSLYGGQLDRIRRTLFGWQTSRATAVQDAATFHRENYFPWQAFSFILNLRNTIARLEGNVCFLSPNQIDD